MACGAGLNVLREEKFFFPIGIQTTERASRSLASILTVQLAPHEWLLKPCVAMGCQ